MHLRRRVKNVLADVRQSLSKPSSSASNKISKSTYKYNTLKPGQIRLLTLLLAEFSAEPVINLHTAVLEKSKPPSYEAISYV